MINKKEIEENVRIFLKALIDEIKMESKYHDFVFRIPMIVVLDVFDGEMYFNITTKTILEILDKMKNEIKDFPDFDDLPDKYKETDGIRKGTKTTINLSMFLQDFKREMGHFFDGFIKEYMNLYGHGNLNNKFNNEGYQ